MPLSPSRKTPARRATPILVDTSAWVEYDRATESRIDHRLTRLIESDGPVAVTEPVVMEICAGARTARRESQLRHLLASFQHLPFDPLIDFESATRIYRRCRRRGITPRGLLDCMIASVAARTGAAVLAFDRDLIAIAEVIELRLDEACHD